MTDTDDRDRRHRLRDRDDDDFTSRRIIRLDEPRPGTSRSKNEYVDVTRLPTRAHKHAKRKNLPSSSTANSSQNQNSAFSNLRPNLSSNEEQNSRNARVQRLVVDSNNCSRNVNEISSSKNKSISCQRPVIRTPPGRAVRVVATSDTRNGAHSSNTYSIINRQPRPVILCSNDQKNKEKALSSSTSLLDPNASSSTSIICKRCGRCRCTACARRKQLPSRWICSNHCLLSSKSIVDAMSCMCCVKACLYHVGGHVYDDCESDSTMTTTTRMDFYESGVVCDCDDLETKSICGDHSLWSCSSKSTDRCFRWTILGSALTCLPCLWLYLPLKTCAAGIETAYSKYYENGCRCERDVIGGGDRERRRLANNRFRRRSRTLPPELPSMNKYHSTATTRNNFDEKKSRRCSLNNVDDET